ncbi:hypothetical protein A4A49_57973 [Nicotiana attenuata]|uniref:GRF-type domain-containing protein n=1 Tax=Nicotiana attenuata TaxID=49451 RepID=A0A1J6JQA2_NICAT|nr:hypothetical protein A4A49_53971 [Nicotiana attenuata]OIT18740.1 hypothetical protein A4A49_57973 [Nicotiana attenuata]
MSLKPRVDSCRCGHECQLKTSLSPSNPGRRFYGCKIKKDKGGCNYFKWVDDEFPSQANRVIWGLLNRVKAFEEERARARTRRKKLASISVMMLIIWVCYCVVNH